MAAGGAAAADFSEFAHGRWPYLVRLAYGLTCDRGLAEDLAQTALANAFASWPRVRRADDPDAYLRRILLNSYRGGFRKRRVTEQMGGTQPDGVVSDHASAHGDHAVIIAALRTLRGRDGR